MRKLSICVPTYNRAHLIRASLETILNQSYSDFDLTVVDNASPDNTEEVVRQIRDPRLRYVRNPENVGLILNNNRCIEEATGELIAIYHDDDFYHKDLVKRSVEILDRNPRVGVVCCAVDIVDPVDPTRVNSRAVMPLKEVNSGHQIRRDLLHKWGSPIPTPTAMVRRACYEQVGVFRDTYGGGSDRELWLRIFRHWDFGYITEPLAQLRDRSKRIPSDADAVARWSRWQWDELVGQIEIQRIHFEEEFANSPARLAVERARLRTATFYELWRWGLLMLAKGTPGLYQPGVHAFRQAGMDTSAAVFELMQRSQLMRDTLARLLRTMRSVQHGQPVSS